MVRFALLALALTTLIASTAWVGSLNVYREDGPVEWLTALLFLSAGGIALHRWARRERSGWLCLIAGIGLLCFMEEIGFGGRLTGLPPLMLNGFHVDGLHDFLHLLKVRTTQYILYGLLTVALGLVIWHRHAVGQRLVRQTAVPAGRFVLLFAILVGLALYVDYVERYSPAYEELLELNAALALCFAAVSSTKEATRLAPAGLGRHRDRTMI